MPPLTLLAVTSGLLFFWTSLLLIERKTNRRGFSRLRTWLDQGCDAVAKNFVSQTPTINKEYFRHIFHFAIHGVLSILLRITQTIERGIRAIVKFNRNRAHAARNRAQASLLSAHLNKVLEHKETSALSSKEREVRKEEALRGDPSPRRKRVARTVIAEDTAG